MALKDDIDAFIANGGVVQHIPTGVGKLLEVSRSPRKDPEDIRLQREEAKARVYSHQGIKRPGRFSKI